MSIIKCHAATVIERQIMQVRIILPLLFMVFMGLSACGDDSKIQRGLPAVHITEAAPSLPSTLTIAPVPTQTATPTALAIFVPTIEATPRKVTVSRISDEIDPTWNRLLRRGIVVPDISVTDIDGNLYPLRQADKIIILNFWTVGCGSCFFEFPLFQAAIEADETGELLVLAVNVSDLVEETLIIAESLKATYPMIVDTNAELFIEYFGGAVVPTTYILAPDGVVAEIIVGPLSAGLLEAELQALGFDIELNFSH